MWHHVQYELLSSLPPRPSDPQYFNFFIQQKTVNEEVSAYSSWCFLSAAEVFSCDPLSNDGIFSREASVGTSVCPPKVRPTCDSQARLKEGHGQGYEPLSCKNRGLQSPRLAANALPSSFAEMILKKDLKRAEGAKEECWNDIVSSSCSWVLILSFVFKLPFKCCLSLWEANGSRCSMFLL